MFVCFKTLLVTITLNCQSITLFWSFCPWENPINSWKSRGSNSNHQFVYHASLNRGFLLYCVRHTSLLRILNFNMALVRKQVLYWYPSLLKMLMRIAHAIAVLSYKGSLSAWYYNHLLRGRYITVKSMVLISAILKLNSGLTLYSSNSIATVYTYIVRI